MLTVKVTLPTIATPKVHLPASLFAQQERFNAVAAKLFELIKEGMECPSKRQ